MGASQLILPTFSYQFLSGPRSKQELDMPIEVGNCRLAVQLFFYKNFDTYIPPEQILNPQAYRSTGEFVFGPEDAIDMSSVALGDVIYAQRKIDKKGNPIRRDRAYFDSEDEWIIYFHTAIILDKKTVYHATTFETNSCTWSMDTFLEHYDIVAIKRCI